jgi:hypothetical protein
MNSYNLHEPVVPKSRGNKLLSKDTIILTFQRNIHLIDNIHFNLNKWRVDMQICYAKYFAAYPSLYSKTTRSRDNN